MELSSKLEELNLTSEEIDRFSKAFKDEKFREMLREYAEEISNPVNKKKYEEEIKLMEEERGIDVKFIHPKPERVLRTSLDGKQKCFLNVCSNDLIGKPECRAEKGIDGRIGQHWSLPYSVTPGRPDLDSKGNKYIIYDVVFHPDTLYIAAKNDRFMKLVDSTAVEGVQDQFKVKLDEKNVKVLKIKYKGVSHPSVIRKPLPDHPAKAKRIDPNDPLSFPYPYDYQKTESQSAQKCPSQNNVFQSQTKVSRNQTISENSNTPTEPHYCLKYRSYIDLQDYRYSRDSAPDPRPKEIVIAIDLPLLKSAENADLNVTEKKIILESQKPAYRLELPLAYPVDENKGEAKFNKLKRQLVVTLPVLPLKSPLVARADAIIGENSNETAQSQDEEADISHQSPDNVVDEKSKAASVTSPNLGCGAHAGACSQGSKGTGKKHAHSSPGNETGGLTLLATQLVLAEGQGYQVSPPIDAGLTEHHREQALINVVHSQAGQARAGLDLTDPDKPSNMGKDKEAGDTESFIDAMREVEKEKAEVNEGDPLDKGLIEREPLLVVLREPSGQDRRAEADSKDPLNEGSFQCVENEPLPVILREPGGEDRRVEADSDDLPNKGSLQPIKSEPVILRQPVGEDRKTEAVSDHLPNDGSFQPIESEPLLFDLRESDDEDRRAEAVNDHRTSAAFSFQNSMLYELD
ncbi:protein kintoun [Megalops cyprinoides]|uniref:protein kintoun n=1 Tax=Megalops cyprinoides TaxID=118141 RepID=UPI001863CBD8|nr:protein kintoun [Megalops cyprinoides]